MSGDVQNGNLKNQLEKELPRDASQRIEGRTSDLYTTQTSNDGKDYISNLPQLIIRGIVKYLDGESLWKCSRKSHKWKAVIDYTGRWEPVCRSLNIPKCRYFEHEFLSHWTQWTIDCGQSGHTWQRAYHREKEVENKWRSGQIQVKELTNIEISKGCTIFAQTYGEWAIVPSESGSLEILDLNRSGRRIGLIESQVQESYLTKFIVMPVPNKPALLIVGSSSGRIHIWELDQSRQFPHRRVLSGHSDRINCLAASTKSSNPQMPDERCLFASGSYDRSVRLWNALTGQHLRVFREHQSPIFIVAFCENMIISSDRDGITRNRHIDVNLKLWRRRWKDVPENLEYDGEYIISVCYNFVKIFKADNPSSTPELKTQLTIHSRRVAIDLINGEVIYFRENELHVYNYKTQMKFRLQTEQNEPISGIACLKAVDKFVFAATSDNKILIYDRRNLKSIHKINGMADVSAIETILAVTDSCRSLLYRSLHSLLCGNRSIPRLYTLLVG